MARLSLSLLGIFQASLDGQPVTGFETAKTRALLAYLADGLGQAYPRSTLAGLLWPERSEVAALSNLRHVLANLRHAIHDAQASPPFLIIERETIALDPHSNFSVDTGDFRRLVGAGSAAKLAGPRSLGALKQAVSLYCGDFLEGFQLVDSPDFEEWILIRREGYREQFLDTLYELAEASLSQGEYDQAKVYAHRQIEVEAWREEAHCQLMQALTLEGRRGEGLAQYTLLCSALKKDLGVGPSQETQRLFERIRDGSLLLKSAGGIIETGESPVVRVQAVPARKLHNLPSQLTSFIGREEEIIAVKSLFCDGSRQHGLRLVTLIGPCGTGKTRLALQAAGELVDYFPDGVWWVELASLADAGMVLPVTAHALGIHDQTGARSLSLLQDFLESRQLLLIFDNCEHLIGACAQLAQTLLQACPRLSVLVTSREALGISGETLFHVLPLSFPQEGEDFPLETLNQYEAIQLFVERANLVSPGYALNSENAPAIVQVCQCLEGIPLAIELAAARTHLLPVEEIVNHLADRFQLLTGGSRTALPRYQTLRASIDWSYTLLTPEERLLLQQLSVFAGSWTLEAARSVSQGEGIEAGQVLERLWRLVDKSLVNTLAAAGNEMRYRMLETIRQYAYEKLVEIGQAEAARDRHLQYYLELAETADSKLRGPEHARYLDLLESELDNIRLALAWSLEGKGKPGWSLEAGLRLAAALLWFWQNHLHTQEGLQWLEHLLARELEERAGMPGYVGRVKSRARALRVAGYLAVGFGDFKKSAVLSEESRDLYRELGPDGEAGYTDALYNLGMIAGGRGHLDLAKTLLEDSLTCYKKAGNRFGEAECLLMLGNCEMHWSEYTRAYLYYEEGLSRYKELGDQDGAACMLLLLGLLAYNQLDLEKARAYTKQSRLMYAAISHPLGVTLALYNLGVFAWLEAEFSQAAQYGNELLSKGQHQGDLISNYYGVDILSGIALYQGDFRRVEELAAACLATARKADRRELVGHLHCRLGAMALAQGDVEQAAQNYTQAVDLRENGYQAFEITALTGLGKIAVFRGEMPAAMACFKRALDIKPCSGYIVGKTEDALDALACLVADQQQMDFSARLLGATDAWYAKFQYTRSPRARQEREVCLERVSTALGEASFHVAFVEGQTMSIEQAVIEAQEFILG